MTAPNTEAQQDSINLGLPWRLQDIDFSVLQPERVRGDDTLFFFQRYSEVESVSRMQVARAIIKRIAEARSEDRMLLRPVDLPRSVRGPLSRLLVQGARGLLFG